MDQNTASTRSHTLDGTTVTHTDTLGATLISELLTTLQHRDTTTDNNTRKDTPADITERAIQTGHVTPCIRTLTDNIDVDTCSLTVHAQPTLGTSLTTTVTLTAAPTPREYTADITVTSHTDTEIATGQAHIIHAESQNATPTANTSEYSDTHARDLVADGGAELTDSQQQPPSQNPATETTQILVSTQNTATQSTAVTVQYVIDYGHKSDVDKQVCEFTAVTRLEALYKATTAAITQALNAGVRTPDIHVSRALLVKQLSGEWVTADTTLSQYVIDLRESLTDFEDYTLTHTP